MVLVVPVYEMEQEGVFYNTAFVIDADGTYLGKYRKHHIPQVKGFWEKFYFRPGNLGYPVFDTAVGPIGVYICYDRHFPEGWRALGLGGRAHCLQPVGDEPRALGVPVEPRTARRGGSQRVLRRARSTASGVEELGDNDFYGSSYFVDPRGQLVGEAASDQRGRPDRARPGHGAARRGPSHLGLLPRPSTRQLRGPRRALGRRRPRRRP